MSHSRYLLPPSAPCWELGQLLHKATMLAWGGRQGCHCLQAVPTALSPGQLSGEPALTSTCSAPGQFTTTAGEAHRVPSGCPAWLAAILTALSPVLAECPGTRQQQGLPAALDGFQRLPHLRGVQSGTVPARKVALAPLGCFSPTPCSSCAGAPQVLFGWSVPHESRRSPCQVPWPLLGWRKVADEGSVTMEPSRQPQCPLTPCLCPCRCGSGR